MLWGSLSTGDEIKGTVFTDLRGCESAEVTGINYDLDATTRFNKLSNITSLRLNSLRDLSSALLADDCCQRLLHRKVRAEPQSFR